MRRLLRRLYRTGLTVVVGAAGLLARRAGATPLTRADGLRGDPRRILVLRLGLLGDGTALLSPTLQRLRQHFPRAEVHVLATPLQRPLLQELPFVDWRDAWRSIVALRREEYDLALAGYGRLASALALCSGAPCRLGYAGEAYPFSLTAALPGRRYDRRGWHEAEYGVALADFAAGRRSRAAASPPEDGPTLRLEVPPAGRAGLARLLAGAPAGRLIVLHAGATNGQAKRWPLPSWVDLAGRLRRDGATVVLAGGPEDRPLGHAIRAAAGDDVLDLSGRTSLPELMALLERADALVTGDSGPLHLAVSLQRPVVAIHGPTDPRLSGPYRAPRARVVRRDLPCSPCYTLDHVAECPLGHVLCQRLVSSDEVYLAVQAVLAG
jgi:lipopolysaccharide heptosyltransferase II